MGNVEPGYRMHAFICGHERPENAIRGCCFEKNSLDLMRALKIRSKQMGLDDVRVQKSGCLNYCEQGPTCVIYPEGKWFKITEESIDSIAKYLADGIIPSEFLLDITA